MPFKSGKIYPHSTGLSCCFRQHLTDSHCKYLHGYALQVELEFERVNGDLDDTNWVMGFGDLKPVKASLEKLFDHKTLVAKNDPHIEFYREGHRLGVMDVIEVDNTGCESFAQMIFWSVDAHLALYNPTVNISRVTVREHAGNWASYER